MKYIEIGLVLVVVASLFIGSDSLSVSEIIENVPQEDVYEFVRYYSRINHESSLQNKESVPDFTTVLGQWLLQKYGVPQNTFARRRSNVICFPNGKCVDVGDAGIHP